MDLLDALYIKTIFVKENIVNEHKSEPVFDWDNILNDDLPFMYFERLPLDFDEELFQYRISDCVYSTFLLKNSIGLSGLYYLNKEKCYVQLV